MKPVILILDDQTQYLRSLERALLKDYNVLLAASVAEAKQSLTGEVDLILTDIRLDESQDDDRQGVDFIRHVRSQDSAVPVVAMSALDASDVESECLAAGATQFVRKPIMVSVLKKLLNELIGGTAKRGCSGDFEHQR